MNFNMNSNDQKLDRSLKEKYGYGFDTFSFLLRNVKAFFELLAKQRSIKTFEDKIQKLETLKTHIFKKLNEYLKTSESQEEIEDDAIMEQFNLAPFFKIIDQKIKNLEKIANLLRSLNIATGKQKRIMQPHTMVALVWILAMREKGRKLYEIFKDTQILLKRISKKEEFKNYFEREINISTDIIRRDYERYIKNPNDKQKIYCEIAFSIYADSLSDRGG